MNHNLFELGFPKKVTPRGNKKFFYILKIITFIEAVCNFNKTKTKNFTYNVSTEFDEQLKIIK